MMDWLGCSAARLRRDRRGVSALEHGILLAVVASVIFVTLGDPLGGLFARFFGVMFETIGSQISSVS